MHKDKEIAQRIKQLMYRLNQKKDSQRYRQGLTKMSFRKAQTRLKIQIGGMALKAGLLEPLGIYLGDDLQKDEQLFDSAATLMGAFLDLADPLKNDSAQKMLWKERGKKALAGP